MGTFEGYSRPPDARGDRSSVRGRVLDADGDPVVGAALRLSAFDFHIDHHTKWDGTYAFDFLDNEFVFTVTPLSFEGNPVEVAAKFGRSAIVNYQETR